MSATADDPFSVLASAYLVMLCIPHSSKLRHEAQEVMARTRDCIAAHIGQSSEYVQNEFEVIASEHIQEKGLPT